MLSQFKATFLLLQFSYIRSFYFVKYNFDRGISFKANYNHRITCCSKYYKTLFASASNVEIEIDEDQLIRDVEADVMAATGVNLEDLINPSKVINLSRELLKLRSKASSTSTSVSDKKNIEESIRKAENTLAIEKRAVMRGWLKNLFLGQSVLALVASYFMVYDIVPNTKLDLPIRVLGFWMWWLFIIPSLRARKPSAWEKEALNNAFLVSPIVSIALPTFTKDVVIIWWANLVATASLYAIQYSLFKLAPLPTESDEITAASTEEGLNQPKDGISKFFGLVFKALDYGSGQERGLRK